MLVRSSVIASANPTSQLHADSYGVHIVGISKLRLTSKSLPTNKSPSVFMYMNPHMQESTTVNIILLPIN